MHHLSFLSVLVFGSQNACLSESNLWLTWFQTPVETALLSSQAGVQLHSIFNWGNQCGLTVLNGEQSSVVQCEVDHFIHST